jgi:hypothetical protein
MHDSSEAPLPKVNMLAELDDKVRLADKTLEAYPGITHTYAIYMMQSIIDSVAELQVSV